MAKKIIFDTDFGGDCDDALALDLLLSCVKNGECELLGITASACIYDVARGIYTILYQHGLESIPVGSYYKAHCGAHDGKSYGEQLGRRFPSPGAPDEAPEGFKLLRRLLAENDNVTLLSTGPLTNLAKLIESEPDEYSDLAGKELVEAKVREIVVMGGCFSHQTGVEPELDHVAEDGQVIPMAEGNLAGHLDASKTVFYGVNVPTVVVPFEVGNMMFTGAPMAEHGGGLTPDSYTFCHCRMEKGRNSWDPATALYAVFGAMPNFHLSVPGEVRFDENGVTTFYPDGSGHHRIAAARLPLKVVGTAIDTLVMGLFED
ncbi:MAG: nucleoside hydrolase [Clostridia bacterium]|nr:nucleoside hydrolase [Clostridia bacterium]